MKRTFIGSVKIHKNGLLIHKKYQLIKMAILDAKFTKMAFTPTTIMNGSPCAIDMQAGLSLKIYV